MSDSSSLPGSIVMQWDPTASNVRNSEGAFIKLKGGRILYVYTKYAASGSDNGNAVLASRFSDDGGKTWSKRDNVEVPQEGNLNVMSVSLLRLRSGRIAMFYLRKDEDSTKRGAMSYSQITCIPFVRFSDDECASWSDPLQVISSPSYYVVNNDRVIQLASGRLLLAAAEHCELGGYHIEKGKRVATRGFRQSGLITFMVSDDDGVSWHAAPQRLFGPTSQATLQEPGVVELANGSIWSLMRSGDGVQWQSFSRDGGMSWTSVEPSAFKSPRSPLSMKRVPVSGELIAVWNDHEDRYGLPRGTTGSWTRTPLVSAVSRDDGLTWTDHTLLESSHEHGFCYTAMHFTDDDHLLLAYLAGGADTDGVLNRMRIRRVALADLGVG